MERACLQKRIAVSAVALSLLVSAATGAAMSLNGIGLLPDGSYCYPLGVSADGSVVVGYADTTGFTDQAFRWTLATGTVGLGYLPGGSWNYSSANGILADGQTIVGGSSVIDGAQPFRWTSATGMQGLGLLAPASENYASGASADGSVIVGYSGAEAFRWTLATGTVGLGDLPGGDSFSQAYGVSADGSVVVGLGHSASSNQEAFRWTSAGGMVGLGDLPGGTFNSEAMAVSADGQVVVGRSDSTLGRQAFRWTSADGMVGLGDLPGGIFESIAYAVSADGSVVVGSCYPGPDAYDVRAFIWDSTHGMRLLSDVLSAGGVDVTGWTLVEAYGISPDGRYVVGSGGYGEVGYGFLADLGAAVPEPGSLGLLLALGSGLAAVRRRRVAR